MKKTFENREVFDRGDYVWTVGDYGTTAKIILEGVMRVYIDNTDDAERVEATRIPRGSVIGLRSLLFKEMRMTTVQCVQHSVVYSLDDVGFAKLLKDSPMAANSLTLSLERDLSHRLGYVSHRIHEARVTPENLI